ncbi:MAG: hypothetical protein WC551_03650 [Patescibacteria group bacterium]
MRLDDWRFSAKRAWQSQFIRWTTIVTGVVIVASSAFFLWRLIPEGLRSGILVLHYNIYLGIDNVQPWQWILALPAGMMAIYLVNIFVALGLYRPDELAAKTLVGFTAALTILWCTGCFFLILINV